MNTVNIVAMTIIFFLLTPGILLKIPNKGSKIIVAGYMLYYLA